MRCNSAAGVEFRVDERAELHGCFDGWVQVQPEFTEDFQVGAEAGARNDDVGLERPAVHGFDGHAGIQCFEGNNAEAGVQFDGPGLHEAAQAGTELAAGGQPVGVTAAVGLLGGRAADRPQDPGARFVLGEVREADQGVGGGVAGADDQGTGVRRKRHGHGP